MTLLQELQAAISAAESVPGSIGLRDYSVSVKKTTSTGSRIGLGTQSSTTLALCTYIPNLEIIDSGINHTNQDFSNAIRHKNIRIGPISSNNPISILNPNTNESISIIIANSDENLNGEYEIINREFKDGCWYVKVRHISR